MSTTIRVNFINTDKRAIIDATSDAAKFLGSKRYTARSYHYTTEEEVKVGDLVLVQVSTASTADVGGLRLAEVIELDAAYSGYTRPALGVLKCDTVMAVERARQAREAALAELAQLEQKHGLAHRLRAMRDSGLISQDKLVELGQALGVRE